MHESIFGEKLNVCGDTGGDFFTIEDLLNVLNSNRDKKVFLAGTSSSIGDLQSWRGSYSEPSIEPSDDCVFNASDIYERISMQLNESHCGYKGGSYTFNCGQEFFVAYFGSPSAYKVNGFVIDGDTLVLLTAKDYSWF